MVEKTRPLGGWLSDHLRATVILSRVFLILSIAGIILLIHNSLVIFTLVLLVIGCAIGIGNGAVFKLVAEYYPKHTGVATGIVRDAGGIGGFFPPLVLGLCKDQFNTYSYNFILLSGFSLLSIFLTRQLKQ